MNVWYHFYPKHGMMVHMTIVQPAKNTELQLMASVGGMVYLVYSHNLHPSFKLPMTYPMMVGDIPIHPHLVIICFSSIGTMIPNKEPMNFRVAHTQSPTIKTKIYPTKTMVMVGYIPSHPNIDCNFSYWWGEVTYSHHILIRNPREFPSRHGD